MASHYSSVLCVSWFSVVERSVSPLFLRQSLSGIRLSSGVPTGTVTAHSDIPDNFVGFTIGKQGSTLQVIQQQSGAKLHVAGKGEYVPGTSNRRITITGPAHSVQIAQMLLQQKVREIEELTAQKGESRQTLASPKI